MKIKCQLKKWTQNKTYQQSNFAFTHDERTKYYLHCPNQNTHNLDKSTKRGTNLVVNYFEG